jgi:hypothetical protein
MLGDDILSRGMRGSGGLLLLCLSGTALLDNSILPAWLRFPWRFRRERERERGMSGREQLTEG